jgi:hypothetical protein
MQRIEHPEGEGVLVRTYNWSVIIPLLTHFYPGIFSGLRTVHRTIEHLLESSLRLEKWQEVHALLALGRREQAEQLMALLRAERNGAEANIEPNAPLENDVMELTPDQLRMYIEGITELMKLNPLVDQRKVSRPKLFEVYWEQDWQGMLREAERHGLLMPHAQPRV